MLRELSVQNLALIEDVRVELSPGFCAWTGETGAGKSLLLGGLNLLLGERGSAESVRSGAEELRVTGVFDITRPELRTALEAILGETLANDTLILSRKLNRSGRSAAYVNDRPVAVATLKSVGELLVDIHGQRESHSLLQPAYQLQLLDGFGHLNELREKYVEKAGRVRSLRKQYAELVGAKQQRQRELALVRFERDELDAANLKSGELSDLSRERERLANAQELVAFTTEGANRLYDEEGSVVEQLGKLLKEAQNWSEVDEKLAEIARRLESLRPEVEDLAETFRNLADRFEADPERLDAVDRRLALIRRLEKKYARTFEDLIAYHSTLAEQESTLLKQEEDLSTISEELTLVFEDLEATALELSKLRAKVARKLASEAQKHLTDLGMPDAKLDVSLEHAAFGRDAATADVPAHGIDQLELQLAANRGEPARPLRKVASGGELSRTMLALKTVLAGHDLVGTLLVFDEIDANVGGRLGDVLGEKLARLGRSHQVICVTHLPQVACFAKHQWTIHKQTKGKRTTTTVSPLTGEQRIEELAK